ncbi:MAG: META domain-containing protein, partial [Thermomicrobiales bacterium]
VRSTGGSMPIKTALLTMAVFTLCAAPVVAQEATPVASDSTTIEPVVWQLQSLADANGENLPGDRVYTVQFQPDGALGVQADCNRGRGDWSADSGALQIGRIGVTRMMCPPGSIDQPFLTTLEGAATWRYEDSALIVETNDGATLVFAPALEGVTWVWEGIQGGDDSVVTPPDPAAYSITFLPNGKLALKADCNRGAGSWTFNNPSIDLQVGALTRMACPEGSRFSEFVRDVDAVSSAVFQDGRLYLALPVDGGIHTFAPRFSPSAGPNAEATPEA